MPPRIPRVEIGLSRISRLAVAPKNQHICLICSQSRSSRPNSQSKRRRLQSNATASRQQYSTASASTTDPAPKPPLKSARSDLRNALLNLQKDAASHVNISKLQLALRGLEQTPGEETIRVAILAIQDGGRSMQKAKELLRLLLADPLKTEEEWERILLNHQPGSKPLLLRIGNHGSEEGGYTNPMVQELHVSSPTMNGYKLEILVLELAREDATEAQVDQSPRGRLLDSVLVPTMEIPTSSTGRYIPITIPVHRSLLVGHGIQGASNLLSLSFVDDLQDPPVSEWNMVQSAANLEGGSSEEAESLPRNFQLVDIKQGSAALVSFRESVDNALDYERNWFASGVPGLVEWLKLGNDSTEAGMRRSIYHLIESLVYNTDEAIGARLIQDELASGSKMIPSSVIDPLLYASSKWAEEAHTELRDQLDIAFDGHRWRKLGWWKLFWRVDDVSMIATDILNRRFLPEAEKELIFLYGRIEEAGLFKTNPPKLEVYAPETKVPKFGSVSPLPKIRDLVAKEDKRDGKVKIQSWPLSIPLTRSYLATETVPALQALAQKLVLKTLTTSSATSAFAALIYVSTLSTSLYEAGAVAAVGIVWSLRRMQGKWETAREFWEGEVREEGRRAVREVEGVVGKVLKMNDVTFVKDKDLEKAERAVEDVKEKLLKM